MGCLEPRFLEGINRKAATKEREAVTVNAVVRLAVYAMVEATKGPTAPPRNLAELRIPRVNPLLDFFPPDLSLIHPQIGEAIARQEDERSEPMPVQKAASERS